MDSVVTASGERFPSVCGGNALYAAAGIAIWERSVGIVTRAGSDYPNECLQAFEDEGISLGGVRRIIERPGLHVAFAYRPDGSRSRDLPPEVLAAIPAEERPRFRDDTHEEERYLAFTPMSSDIPTSWFHGLVGVHLPQLRKASQATVVDALRGSRPDLLITLDAWHESDSLEPADRSLLEGVDAFLPSEEDAQRLCPGLLAPEAARELQRHGARQVVIKLGDAGCLVRTADGEAWHVPAYAAAVTDLTGAGDAFCGGFLVGLHETGDPVRAALFGTVSASFVVEHATAAGALAVGRAAADVRRAELTQRIEQVAGEVRAVRP
ncbi:MAG: carbohydrate kinase family protein [Chloroflexota bacterium]|nr:carbohydrate kinase family protein [Chloroflexota bacterium]